MMLRLATAFIGLAAAGLLGSAPAAAEEKKPEVACAADSPTMTIGEITALGDAAIGRCVTVEGWALGFFLQADNEARYRPERIYNDYTSTGAVLGLYGRNRALAPAVVRATGRIDSCKAVYDRIIAAGEVPFLGGFCHYHYGLVINATALTELGKPDLVRIPAAAAKPGLGDLSPMANSAARDTLSAAFAPLREALVNRDAARLRELLRIEGGVPMSDDRLTKLVTALTAADSPAAALTGDAGPVTEIFGWHEPAWADAETRAGNAADEEKTTSGIVCTASRRAADAGLWPIDEADTGFASGRPYICARIFIGALREGGERITQYAVYPEERIIREPA